MNSIIEKQNDPELIKLLKASTVAYSKAKKGENTVTFLLILLAFAYPVFYTLIQDEAVKIVLFGCSFLLTVCVLIFTNTFKGNTSKGAIFKEVFDTALFNLPWKSTIIKPEHSEVSKFSLQYKGKDIEDWYSTNLSKSIPHNIAVALLQYSNTSWDIELRVIFRRWLAGFLIGYSIILWIFLFCHNVNFMTIFLIYFSSLSSYTHLITLINGHSSAINKRRPISKYLDNIIRHKKNISVNELRDIQDEIFISRQEPAKVPNFFFRLYQKKMNAIIKDFIDSVNSTYNL